jgi:hypothetical protein
MAKGGKRPGAGRPKGTLASHTLQAQEMRKRLIKAALENWDAIIFSLIDRSIAGDSRAISELLDRVFGKATAQVELSGPGGLPFQIIVKQQPSAASGSGAVQTAV